MITITDHVDINAPLETVYEFATRFDKNPLWQTDAKSVEIPIPIQAGSEGVVLISGLGRETRSSFKILECIPDTRLTVASSAGPIEFIVTYRFEALSPTATRFHWVSEVKVGNYYRLAETVIEHISRIRIQGNLASIKLLLESTPIEQLID